MLTRKEIKEEQKKGCDIQPRYRCQYCGNKLFFEISKRGFNVVCPMCQVLTKAHATRQSAILSGLRGGEIYDLESFTGSYVQMSCVPEPDSGDDE